MRGSALLVFGRGFALIIGVATQVLIVRALTKEDFGAFAGQRQLLPVFLQHVMRGRQIGPGGKPAGLPGQNPVRTT